MNSGFEHFDSSHLENFCAAVLLLAMEVDDSFEGRIARFVPSPILLTPPANEESA